MSENQPSSGLYSELQAKGDLPFDLNNLFTLTYSFDVLKQTIEFLAKTQAAHSKMLSHLVAQEKDK